VESPQPTSNPSTTQNPKQLGSAKTYGSRSSRDGIPSSSNLKNKNGNSPQLQQRKMNGAQGSLQSMDCRTFLRYSFLFRNFNYQKLGFGSPHGA
jgi:hypothetical protein